MRFQLHSFGSFHFGQGLSSLKNSYKGGGGLLYRSYHPARNTEGKNNIFRIGTKR